MSKIMPVSGEEFVYKRHSKLPQPFMQTEEPTHRVVALVMVHKLSSKEDQK